MDPQCKQNYVLSMFTGKCLKNESCLQPCSNFIQQQHAQYHTHNVHGYKRDL